ncbi:hypothetical protein HY483_02920, partial [Candidatus Woesearchaeota archaeon]|nr:hypothetical protein [Candidatus Woesearchaeota archaeon]
SSAECRELLRKGLEAHVAGTELFLPVTDSLVARLLKNGRKTKPLESSPLRASTVERVGGSEYSTSDYNIALFGSQEIAELNASYLRARGKQTGFSYDFTREQLEDMLNGKEGHVHVRPCSLCGGNYGDIDDVDADSVFYYLGRARGTSAS